MKKAHKLLGFTIVLLLFSIALTGVASAQAWPDLTPQVLDDYGITEAQVGAISDGYTDGLWRPYRDMPRRHFAKMAVEQFGLTPINSATPTFSDVPKSNPFYGYIEAASAAGLINGIGGGLFAPDATISREQAAAIIIRFKAGEIGLDLIGMSEADLDELLDTSVEDVLNDFVDDAQVSVALREEMALAVACGIVKGTLAKELNPRDNLLRIQGAAMLIRSIDCDLTEIINTVSVTLTQGPSLNAVGTTHDATATVQGIEGQTYFYRFAISGANATATVSEDTTGTVEDGDSLAFSYIGTSAGTDTLTFQVFADAARTQLLASDEATKTWAVFAMSVDDLTPENVVETTHVVEVDVAPPFAEANFYFTYEVVGRNASAETTPTLGATTFTLVDEGNPLAPGTDVITVRAYADAAGTVLLDELVITKTWVLPAGVLALALSPEFAVNCEDETHTVLATVTVGGAPPAAPVDVVFAVTAGDEVVATATVATGAGGTAELTFGPEDTNVYYTISATVTPTIGASVDATATKVWAQRDESLVAEGAIVLEAGADEFDGWTVDVFTDVFAEAIATGTYSADTGLTLPLDPADLTLGGTIFVRLIGPGDEIFWMCDEIVADDFPPA